MLVENVQTTIYFYLGLGFHVAAFEIDATGHPLWALLRRGEADLFIQERTEWPQALIPLPQHPTPMTLVLGDAGTTAQTDPDGVRVEGLPDQQRRAA